MITSLIVTTRNGYELRYKFGSSTLHILNVAEMESETDLRFKSKQLSLNSDTSNSIELPDIKGTIYKKNNECSLFFDMNSCCLFLSEFVRIEIEKNPAQLPEAYVDNDCLVDIKTKILNGINAFRYFYSITKNGLTFVELMEGRTVVKSVFNHLLGIGIVQVAGDIFFTFKMHNDGAVVIQQSLPDLSVTYVSGINHFVCKSFILPLKYVVPLRYSLDINKYFQFEESQGNLDDALSDNEIIAAIIKNDIKELSEVREEKDKAQ